MGTELILSTLTNWFLSNKINQRRLVFWNKSILNNSYYNCYCFNLRHYKAKAFSMLNQIAFMLFGVFFYLNIDVYLLSYVYYSAWARLYFILLLVSTCPPLIICINSPEILLLWEIAVDKTDSAPAPMLPTVCF